MGRDKVRDQVLLLARFLGELLEHLLEAVIAAYTGLHHLAERPFLGMLGCNLQIPPNMVRHQLLDVLRRLDRQVVAQARGDQDLLHPRQCTRLAVKLDQRGVVGIEVVTDARIDARGLATGRLDFRALAGNAVHVGRWATQIGDHPGKARHLVTHVLDFTDDRVVRTVLDNAPFVLGDRAEGTTTKAAAHDIDREANHLVGRNTLAPIDRVRHPRVGQAEDVVHLLGAQRNRRRVEPDIAITVTLHQRTGVTRVGLQVQHAVGMGVEHRITLDLLKGRQPDYRTVTLKARVRQQFD